MIQNIEKFRTELDVESFADLVVLNEREVEVAYARPNDAITSAITQSRRLCRRYRGTAGIRRNKTLCLDVMVRIAGIDRILTLRRVYAVGHIERVDVSHSERIATNRWREWQSRCSTVDATQLPTACHPFESTVVRFRIGY